MQNKSQFQVRTGVVALAFAALFGASSSAQALSVNASLSDIQITVTDLAADGKPAYFIPGAGISSIDIAITPQSGLSGAKSTSGEGEFLSMQLNYLHKQRRPGDGSFQGYGQVGANSLFSGGYASAIPQQFLVHSTVKDTATWLTLAPHTRLDITATEYLEAALETEFDFIDPLKVVLNASTGMRADGDLFAQAGNGISVGGPWNPPGDELFQQNTLRLILVNDSDSFKSVAFSAWTVVSGFAAPISGVPEPEAVWMVLAGAGIALAGAARRRKAVA